LKSNPEISRSTAATVRRTSSFCAASTPTTGKTWSSAWAARPSTRFRTFTARATPT
jgi:hypothetical protein